MDMFDEVEIANGELLLRGLLSIPKGATLVVLFAHGSGSGRLSSRNQFVAKTLVDGGIGALLMDLLTEQEEAIDKTTRELRFDIELLAERLLLATDWMKEKNKELRIGYFGASTGAAAALLAAGDRDDIAAIVSRGGRPDLAIPAFSQVKAPTLLIVGGNDHGVIELNQQAYQALECEKKLEIIPGATHLFEETGTIEQVAKSALAWFQSHSQ
jgi:putative phosphoribosyl transferase